MPITFKILVGKQPRLDNTDNRSYSSVRLSNRNQEERIDIARLKDGSINGGVPLFMTRLYPKLKLKNFLSLCQQDSFLSQKTQVCEDCFLKATQDYEKTLLEGLNTSLSTGGMRRSVSRERPPSVSYYLIP